MGQRRPDRIKAFGNSIGAPGQGQHETVRGHAGDLAGEHRVWRRLEPLVAHHLGHAGHLVVEHRLYRLRGHIPGAESGPPGEDEEVGVLCAAPDRRTDRFDVVGHALARDHVGREQRESSHDDVAAAVVRIDSTAAVTDGDLGGAPTVIVARCIGHSRMIRSCPA